METPVTVAEIDPFESTARRAGLTEDERHRLIDYLARHPEKGDLIPGTGGLRKLRWGKGGRGKRAGYRAIYYFFSEDFPICLLAIYPKNQRVDLSAEQRKQLSARRYVEGGLSRGDWKKEREMKKRKKIDVGAELIEGMTNAVAHARGLKAARRETIVKVEIPDLVNVRAIRGRLGMSQAAFAARFGFSIKNVRNWEQGERQPQGPARAYLLVIDRNPQAVQRALARAS